MRVLLRHNYVDYQITCLKAVSLGTLTLTPRSSDPWVGAQGLLSERQCAESRIITYKYEYDLMKGRESKEATGRSGSLYVRRDRDDDGLAPR